MLVLKALNAIPNHGSTFHLCLPAIQKAPHLFFSLDPRISHLKLALQCTSPVDSLVGIASAPVSDKKEASAFFGVGGRGGMEETKSSVHSVWWHVCRVKQNNEMYLIDKYHFSKFQKKICPFSTFEPPSLNLCYFPFIFFSFTGAFVS